MTAPDISIIVILIISVAAGVYRGLVRESLSLVVWVAALLVAIRFSELSAVWISDFELFGYPLPGADLQLVLLFVLLFVGVLIVGSVIKNAVSRAVRHSFMGLSDRLLGGLFGVARSGVIVLALVLVSGLTSLPFADEWRSSVLVPPFERAARYVMCYAPDGYHNPHYQCARDVRAPSP